MESFKISHDQQINQQYQEDPLVYHSSLKMRTLRELERGAKDSLSISENVTFPFHISCGEKDELVDSKFSRIFHENAKSLSKSIRIYKNFKHELLIGKGSRTVRTDLLDWLESRINSLG